MFKLKKKEKHLKILYQKTDHIREEMFPKMMTEIIFLGRSEFCQSPTEHYTNPFPDRSLVMASLAFLVLIIYVIPIFLISLASVFSFANLFKERALGSIDIHYYFSVSCFIVFCYYLYYFLSLLLSHLL